MKALIYLTINLQKWQFHMVQPNTYKVFRTMPPAPSKFWMNANYDAMCSVLC